MLGRHSSPTSIENRNPISYNHIAYPHCNYTYQADKKRVVKDDEHILFMTDTSLPQQVANRARVFHKQTGITQAQMASAMGIPHGNYSAFLANKRGIGSEVTCLLLKYTNMPKQQAIADLGDHPSQT
jgi:hypothetical protein